MNFKFLQFSPELSTWSEDKFPDWSKIMEAGASAADAMTGGIGTLTSKIGESLTDLDDQVQRCPGMSWDVLGCLGLYNIPRSSIYGTYSWVIFGVNVGKYTIHG